MKDLRNYIDLYELNNYLLEGLDENPFDININESGIGDFFKNIFNRWRTMSGLDRLNKQTRASIQAYLLTSMDSENGIILPKDKERLLKNSEDVEKFYTEVKDLVNKYKNIKRAYSDSSFIYACVALKQLAEDKLKEDPKNKEYKETLNTVDAILDNIPADDKEAAIESRKKMEKEVKQEKEKETSSNTDVPQKTPSSSEGTPDKTGETTDGGSKETTVTEPAVKSNVKKDPLAELIEQAQIDKDKLATEVYALAGDKSKWKLDDADNVILGLSSIICGAILIQNGSTDADTSNKVLNTCGIGNFKEFIGKIKKVAN